MNGATSSTAPPVTHAPRRGLQILFLAARPATASALQQTLRHAPDTGFHLAVDPEEAVAMARSRHHELILIDLPWAGRAGERLVEQLRAAGVTSRVAVLGDLYGTRGREAARRIGAHGFTPDAASPDLLKVIRALVDATPSRPPVEKQDAPALATA